jgi:hypothetical protein
MGDSYLPILLHLFTWIRYQITTSYAVVFREEQAHALSCQNASLLIRERFLVHTILYTTPPLQNQSIHILKPLQKPANSYIFFLLERIRSFFSVIRLHGIIPEFPRRNMKGWLITPLILANLLVKRVKFFIGGQFQHAKIHCGSNSPLKNKGGNFSCKFTPILRLFYVYFPIFTLKSGDGSGWHFPIRTTLASMRNPARRASHNSCERFYREK